MTENIFTALPTSKIQLDHEKFTLTDDSKVAVRTKGSFTGTFSASGLTICGRFSEVTINDLTWTALQPVGGPLANRNALAIQNLSGVDMKVQYDSGLAGYKGMTIKDQNERQYDITETIIIYGKSASGTVAINVEEIA